MTPLVLLVGFLGAGKTTFIRTLLPALAEHGIEPHVIINDYQNARVDAQLLDGLAESVVPISGSCVCCGSRDELMSALEKFEPRTGRVVIVEANGTTDAEELIEMLSLEPGLDRFTAPIQVSLVDGKRWQRRFWHNGLELDQARTAAFLHISRDSEIDERRRAGVLDSLRKHGIAAPLVTPEEFSAELAGIAAEVAETPDRTKAGHGSDCGCGHDHDGHPHHHSEGLRDDCHVVTHHFSSCQVEMPAQVSRKLLEDFLDGLPGEVIRAKGLVRLDDSPDEYHVFQKVDRFDSAQILPIGTASRLSHPVAVFIGPGIDEDDLRARVAKLHPVENAPTRI